MATRVVASFYTGAIAIEPGGRINRAVGSRPEAIINATDAYAAPTEDEIATETFAVISDPFIQDIGITILTALGGDAQIYIGKNAPKGDRYDILLDGSQRAFGIRSGQRVYIRMDA